MKTSEKMGLNIPESNDFVDVDKLAENFEKIDSSLNGISFSVEDGILTATYDDGKE